MKEPWKTFSKRVSELYSVDESAIFSWIGTFQMVGQYAVYFVDTRVLSDVEPYLKPNSLIPGTNIFIPLIGDFPSALAKFVYVSDVLIFPRGKRIPAPSYLPVDGISTSDSFEKTAEPDLKVRAQSILNRAAKPKLRQHDELRKRVTRSNSAFNPILDSMGVTIVDMTARGETDYSWPRITLYHRHLFPDRGQCMVGSLTGAVSS